eukprot:6950949-Alexandrium_andersonii.AAC.1
MQSHGCSTVRIPLTISGAHAGVQHSLTALTLQKVPFCTRVLSASVRVRARVHALTRARAHVRMYAYM